MKENNVEIRRFGGLGSRSLHVPGVFFTEDGEIDVAAIEEALIRHAVQLEEDRLRKQNITAMTRLAAALEKK